jgi:hypothetical protein
MALTKIGKEGITGISNSSDAVAITIDSSERVGIGNSTPSSYENGATNLVVGNTGDTGMTIASGTSNLGSIFFADGTSGGAKYEGQIRYNHASNFMMFATGGTERMRILSTGGITFNGDTATANALDDYEEGTFTPTLLASTTNPTVTYVVRTGAYTKIGNTVHVFGRIQTSSVSGGVGTALIGLLPFTTDGTYRSGGGLGYISGVSLSSGFTYFGLSPDAGTTTIRLVQSGSGISSNIISIGVVANAFDITFTHTYRV